MNDPAAGATRVTKVTLQGILCTPGYFTQAAEDGLGRDKVSLSGTESENKGQALPDKGDAHLFAGVAGHLEQEEAGVTLREELVRRLVLVQHLQRI